MSQERKRGCGYRKVHGTYLVGGGVGVPCDRLPYELTCCPTCSQGIKPARGWTWVDVAKLFEGPHGSVAFNYPLASDPTPGTPCACRCPLCRTPEKLGKAGLLWIGEKFYKFPNQFIKEGVDMGFSRRIKAVPQGFKIGETWVLLAHLKALSATITTTTGEPPKTTYTPGIFYAWLPQRIEILFNESERDSAAVKAAEKRGIFPVFVPDGDKDHHGNVHDDAKQTEEE